MDGSKNKVPCRLYLPCVTDAKGKARQLGRNYESPYTVGRIEDCTNNKKNCNGLVLEVSEVTKTGQEENGQPWADELM